MQIGNRQFKPSLVGTFATLVLVPVLMSLGFWQLRRADEKQALIARLHEGANTTQLVGANNIELLPLLQTVSAHGHYDGTRQILLDNMWSNKHVTAEGQAIGVLPGMNVLTPFALDDGHIVLVNRGWLPFGRTRQDLPAINIGGGPRSLRGLVSSIPQPGMRLQDNAASHDWPRLLNYPTLTELRALYGEQLLPRLILLDAAEADGYERNWSARYDFGDFGPDRHIGYAAQWFGLAFALVVLYCVVSLKRHGQP